MRSTGPSSSASTTTTAYRNPSGTLLLFFRGRVFQNLLCRIIKSLCLFFQATLLFMHLHLSSGVNMNSELQLQLSLLILVLHPQMLLRLCRHWAAPSRSPMMMNSQRASSSFNRVSSSWSCILKILPRLWRHWVAPS